MSINQVTLFGKLGRDPELRAVGTTFVANLSVATDETYTDKDGNRHEKTEWHRVVVWGKPAEYCAANLTKGSAVCVLGKLETNVWKNKDGVEQKTVQVRADRVEFAERREGAPKGPATGAPAGRPPSRPPAGGGYPSAGDDIPFARWNG